MTNEQILKKAIRKAVKNGWNASNNWHLVPKASYGDKCIRVDMITLDGEYGCAIKVDEFSKEYYVLVFSHDFAKAFWGEELTETERNKRMNYDDIKRWKHHLQAMVLEEEPLKYLEKFL